MCVCVQACVCVCMCVCVRVCVGTFCRYNYEMYCSILTTKSIYGNWSIIYPIDTLTLDMYSEHAAYIGMIHTHRMF